jgi:transcriptional regulator with XRE-family HTH domain
MEDAGQKLKRARERLNLRYRDVEEASQRIAERTKNDEFIVALSRLADIENKGTLPSIFRLYSLCAIYRLDIADVLEWYGIDLASMGVDAASVPVERTHTINFTASHNGGVQVPLQLEPGIDLRRSTFLSRFIQSWGIVPLMLLNKLDVKEHRYAFIGTEDWSMYPLLQPGSLVIIDEAKRKIASGGWTSEFDRPIYFLETRQGYLCGWCSLDGDQLTVLPHPSATASPQSFAYPAEIDVVGQVTGVAMRLDPGRRPRTRS